MSEGVRADLGNLGLRYRITSLGIPFSLGTDILGLLFFMCWIILEIGCELRWPAGLEGGLRSLSWSCHKNEGLGSLVRKKGFLPSCFCQCCGGR